MGLMFINEITQKIWEKFDISKLEDDTFRFTGIDVQRNGDEITKAWKNIQKVWKNFK